jgi:putative transposase
VPQAQILLGQLLPLAQQVRRHGRIGREATEALEAENARLKKLLAELMLENEVTREALRKKW